VGGDSASYGFVAGGGVEACGAGWLGREGGWEALVEGFWVGFLGGDVV